MNIGNNGDFSDIQKIAHELTHASQYLNQELDLKTNGSPGYLYDKQDEIQALERQNLFLPISPGATPVDSETWVNDNYGKLKDGPKSFHSLSPARKAQYIKNVAGGRIKIGGWRKMK